MIKRELYLNEIKPFINKHFIKVLTGVRRCGKSTILEQIIQLLKQKGIKDENIILINFELDEYFNIRNKDQLKEYINKLVKNNKEKKYLFLDEVQKVEGWEELVNSYLAKDKFDIYITGSNAKLLSGELATYLSGRYVEIKIYPFSFKEFLKYKELKEKTKSEKDYKKLFNEYMKYGAMPSTLGFNDKEKIKIFRDLYNSIILKDVVQRNEIRDIDLLDRIVRFTMANIGQLFSAKNIVNYLKKDKVSISTKTIYNYLSYLEDACLINKVRREDLIGKKLLNYIEKFYVVDLGFRQIIYGKNIEDIGQTLENIVYNELIRKGYDITIGKFYEKEVDFVCKKNNKTIYIQVTYILADDNTIKREFEPLTKINDNYPKYVFSMDDFDRSRQGIKHVNIVDFLTGEMDK
ncbi:ATP-binding protein [Methanobrevibacter curvatus]|uniref:Archaeal ATPase n=1 Tax=Methanobrevibacter curvatus TaxID=49547 RepID=A0A166E9M3_9EURY|nr:ATP-binding protein [Methanobrevibacter curvatus]KZX16423.1 archaeal ATPase [Methanobrevibacter curvatus]